MKQQRRETEMRRLAWILPLILFTGCAHKPDVKAEAPPPTPKAEPAKNAPVTELASTRACTQDSDCKDSEICSLERQCVPMTNAALNDCNLVRVHFAFNSSEIDSSDRGQLERSARCLQGHQHVHVTIEGNADERGTEEYNLALGDRRALSVAKYLEKLGASEAQLKTLSYGEERPVCNEHDEACWAKNRRAAVRSPFASNEN
jgi:peptidoglycan-associated lipoprotein